MLQSCLGISRRLSLPHTHESHPRERPNSSLFIISLDFRQLSVHEAPYFRILCLSGCDKSVACDLHVIVREDIANVRTSRVRVHAKSCFGSRAFGEGCLKFSIMGREWSGVNLARLSREDEHPPSHALELPWADAPHTCIHAV